MLLLTMFLLVLVYLASYSGHFGKKSMVALLDVCSQLVVSAFCLLVLLVHAEDSDL